MTMMYTKDIQSKTNLKVTSSFDGKGFKVLCTTDGWLTERTYESESEAYEWINFMNEITNGRELITN